MIPGIILSWLGGNWRWLVPSVASISLLGALWLSNNVHALQEAKQAAVIANLETAVADCKTASAQAKANAEIARRNKETEYANKASDSDRANADLRRMYAKKLQARIHSSTTNASPANNGAGLPETAPAQTELVGGGIIISLEDAEICTENTAKLESAMEWAAGL